MKTYLSISRHGGGRIIIIIIIKYARKKKYSRVTYKREFFFLSITIAFTPENGKRAFGACNLSSSVNSTCVVDTTARRRVINFFFYKSSRAPDIIIIIVKCAHSLCVCVYIIGVGARAPVPVTQFLKSRFPDFP